MAEDNSIFREETIKLNGRSISVREMKAKEVVKLTGSREGLAVTLGVISGDYDSIVCMMKKSVDVPEAELETLIEGANNYALLEAAFRRVNSDFLASLPDRFEGLIKVAKGIMPAPSKSVAG